MSPNPRGTVLIVEDEAPLRQTLRLYLEAQACVVIEAGDGAMGWELFQTHRPDLVLLDLMIPLVPGEALCRRIRAVSNDLPLLVMTAKTQESTALALFGLGADDFVRKPFSPRELTARVMRRLATRAPATGHQADALDLVRGLRFDRSAHQLLAHETEVRLTPHEADLALVFLQQPGRLFSREQLIAQAWPAGFDGSDRAVDSHIKNLRRKLPRDRDGQSPIEAIYGRGYRWRVL